jgi:hypothetical protein
MASPSILQIEAIRWVLTAIGAVLLWGIADYFLYRRHTRKADANPAAVDSPPLPTSVSQSVATEAGVYLECHIAQLPEIAPPSGRVYIFNPLPLRAGGGMAEMFTFKKEGGTLGWPKRADGAWFIVYHCKITSYRKEPIFQIAMNLRMVFREAIRDADGKSIRSGPIEIDREWPIEIGKLEPGDAGSFDFYIYNINDKWVQITFPGYVSAVTVADNSRREIPLIQQASRGVEVHLLPYSEEKDGKK